MDKLAPFHHLSAPFYQNSLNRKPKPKTHSPTFLALGVTDTSSLEIDPHFVSPPLPSSSNSLRQLSNTSFPGSVSELKSLNSVKMMHAHMIKLSSNWNSDAIAKKLITYYLEFGDFRSAAMVFFMGFARNYVLWNSFVKEFVSFEGNPYSVLEVFGELHCKGVVFDSGVIAMVLKICATVMDLWLGVEVHACLIKRGFDLDGYVMSSLINFYGRCWDVESALQVFSEMPDRGDLLWNEAIMVHLIDENWMKALELFRDMQFLCSKANGRTIVKVLQACGKVRGLNEGKQIHGYVLRCALESSNLSICNSLISMYTRNDKLEIARRVFDSMKDHNLSSWNSIISGYATLGYLNDAWKLFHEMQTSHVKPDIITWNSLLSGHSLYGSYKEVLTILRNMQSAGFKPNSSSVTSVLQAVIELGNLNFGKEIHGYVIRNALDCDVYVGTSLIDMYVKSDCLSSAQAVFDSTKKKNIFAWNSLISGYSFKGLFEDAEKLLYLMEKNGIKPDLVTWNGLVSGYSMWGRNKEALSMIDEIRRSGLTPNVVSWTALISGSSQNENYRESLEFFIQMQQEGVQANSATISSLLRACGGLSLLQKGEEIHCLSIRIGFIEDIYVSTALIDMYSKSGNLKSAHEVFKKIQNKTLATWNCMIMGFAIYGLGKEAILIFDEMNGAGIQPNSITFTAVLSGCKNSGLVDEGWKYFDSMIKDYKISPTIEHCSCMVDLLGRAGYLDEAWDFIHTMPLKPDAIIWGALLASCRIHKNIRFAEIAAKKLFELEPYNSANYVLMMNLYAILNRWEDVEQLKYSMALKGVQNGHVWSWIQIDQTVHVFFAEGKPHPNAGEIYFELYQLMTEMKKLGYTPDINCVYQNIDEVEKEKVLMSHPEKLAITYGLMKTKTSDPIRVIKNTRVCSDCHTAAKYMSLVRSREIFLRDGVRFHHFRDGKCSCNDCW